MMEPQRTEQENLHSLIASLSRVISAVYYPSGDRAALKRYAPGSTISLAFYRLWWHYLDREPPADSETWATIAFGIAYMGDGAHRADRSLGVALAEAKYSETRLEQLLACPADLRGRLFTSAIRFLAAQNEGFNWMDAAQFLLVHDEEKREALHRRIARDFYRVLRKSNPSQIKKEE